MINRKGRALVEFILVLPIIILLLFAVIDVGRIVIAKNHLENVMSDCVDMASANQDIGEIKAYVNSDTDYKITFSETRGTYTIFKLETKINLMTPGLKRILNSPYKITLERRIINEQ